MAQNYSPSSSCSLAIRFYTLSHQVSFTLCEFGLARQLDLANETLANMTYSET